MTIIEKETILDIYNSIQSKTEDCIFKTKHGIFTGEKDFALCILETMLTNLKKKTVDDIKLINNAKILNSLIVDTNHNFYITIINHCSPNKIIKKYGLSTLKSKDTLLTQDNKRHLKAISTLIIFDYLTLGNYERVDYPALNLIILTVYTLLVLNLNIKYNFVSMNVDIYDKFENIIIKELDEDESIWENLIIDLDYENQVYASYSSYRNSLLGLKDTSVAEITSAILMENEFYEDERFTASYGMLAKQYCSIIETEVNDLIQILNLPNKPTSHLMWNSMKKYIKDNNINLIDSNLKLYNILDELHDIRNRSAHGEIITREDYEILKTYITDLFIQLSNTKLVAQNKIIHPTIMELYNSNVFNFKSSLL